MVDAKENEIPVAKLEEKKQKVKEKGTGDMLVCSDTLYADKQYKAGDIIRNYQPHLKAGGVTVPIEDRYKYMRINTCDQWKLVLKPEYREE